MAPPLVNRLKEFSKIDILNHNQMDGIGIGNWYQFTEFYKLLVFVWYIT